MKPFVKWAGGKTALLPELKKYIPTEYKNYYEPFVGGGAMYFYLRPDKSHQCYLNDLNKELIDTYECMINDLEFNTLVETLRLYMLLHGEAFYYQLRNQDRIITFSNQPLSVHASRLIYLNKCCFNGVYRVNRKGYFNVPFNAKATFNPDLVNLQEIHSYMASSKPILSSKDFEDALSVATVDDFVYIDPPYDNTFDDYTSLSFHRKDQERLHDTIVDLTKRGVKVMLSSSSTEFMKNLYSDPIFKIITVEAPRRINSNGKGRGKVEELVILNYGSDNSTK